MRSLSDDDLLRLSEVTRQSRRVEAELVALIAEVDARRLTAREATPSMFTCCTEVLHEPGGVGGPGDGWGTTAAGGAARAAGTTSEARSALRAARDRVVDTPRIPPVLLAFRRQARGSVVERFLDTEEVGGSIPPAPTIPVGGCADTGHGGLEASLMMVDKL